MGGGGGFWAGVNKPEKMRVMVIAIGPAHAQRSSQARLRRQEVDWRLVVVADGGQRAQNLDLGTRHCGLPGHPI